MPFFVHFIFLPFRAFFVVTTCILRLFGAFLVVVVCTFHINAYTIEGEIIETIDFNNLSKEQKERIYKTVSFTGNECHFVKSTIASLIKSYDAKSKIGELGSLNKLEVTISGDSRIKEVCIKLKVDRLGNITKA